MRGRVHTSRCCCCACHGRTRAIDESVWSGVYTAPQATSGEAIDFAACAKCHGDDLGGLDALALAGGTFGQRWDGATLKKLFERLEADASVRSGGAPDAAETPTFWRSC